MKETKLTRVLINKVTKDYVLGVDIFGQKFKIINCIDSFQKGNCEYIYYKTIKEGFFCTTIEVVDSKKYLKELLLAKEVEMKIDTDLLEKIQKISVTNKNKPAGDDIYKKISQIQHDNHDSVELNDDHIIAKVSQIKPHHETKATHDILKKIHKVA